MHLPGHLGITLLLVAPVVVLYGERIGLTFSALAVPFSMLPDVDLVLPTVSHHGITHTVAFVVGASLLLGAVCTIGYRAIDAERRWAREAHPPQAVFGFATAAVLLAGLGHLGLDMLSAPDIAPPLQPLWPLAGSLFVGLDLLPVNSTVWNFGLLGAGLATWIGAYAMVR